MIKVHADLPEWSFEIDEVSAGVYEVTASDNRGRRFSSKGTDPDALLESCREQAMRLAQAGKDAT
jgi:hypothetical protein